MTITIATTLYSVYEVDQSHKLVRRLDGVHRLTKNQERFAGVNGWAAYLAIGWVGRSLFFVWEVDDLDRIVRRTLTSEVVAFEGVPVTNIVEECR